ncbi:hypothetical protein [Actinomadura violacea]|uniref:Glycerophosphoryl diester phosphodiesterase membrane domain-containing protein n=1 Tax=Actinomadura violacea TaxID=2819934 RepID=A0ABS3RJ64_9ACTN|nr:hypothetical protein [Actinomadura violacea]MBO2456776.1 hypothetical protein [Actinomadura violacea]
MPGPDGWDDDADTAVPFRPMSISEMLDGSIAGIRRRPRTALGIALAFSTVIQVASSVAAYFFIGNEARNEVTPGLLIRSFGAQVTLAVMGLVLSAYGILVLSGLLAPILGRELVGMPVAPRQAWRDARPRLGRLAATAALVLLVPLAAMTAPIIPFILLVASNAHPALGALAAIVGFPIGIGLMVWSYILLVQAVPAVVLERTTVGGALKRARVLSKGRWFRTCGTLLLAILITVFMGFFALRIPFLVIQLILFGTGSDGGSTVGALAVDTAGRIISWAVVLPFDAGVIALLYMDRRMRREGLDLDLRTRGRSAAAVAAGSGRDASGPSSESDPSDGNGRADEGDEEGFIDLWRPRPVGAWHGTGPEAGARG